MEHVQAVTVSTVIAPQLEELRRGLESTSDGFLKLDVTPGIPETSVPPMEADSDLQMLRFPCCHETVKVANEQEYYCIICGGEINMAPENSTKIFLSHKGSDKATIVDFKKTLELLGYEPWLDDEAMPAGTALERGLLAGMQESCAVVFFITPSFVDEGYLKTEIDYAIREKRKKEDRFSIITLRFVDDNVETPPVPELLQSYVWKTPETKLGALREIVRALPVAAGPVEWREPFTDVKTRLNGTPAHGELSKEAKELLKEAVADDGRVYFFRAIGGSTIRAGKKTMVHGNNQRSLALWKGGLEDLQRLRYIKDIGHEGKAFEVTREGYEAADGLS